MFGQLRSPLFRPVRPAPPPFQFVNSPHQENKLAPDSITTSSIKLDINDSEPPFLLRELADKLIVRGVSAEGFGIAEEKSLIDDNLFAVFRDFVYNPLVFAFEFEVVVDCEGLGGNADAGRLLGK